MRDVPDNCQVILFSPMKNEVEVNRGEFVRVFSV